MAHGTLLAGLGGRGRTWAKTLIEHDQFSIEGLLDIDRPAIERIGAELGVPSEYRYTDYQEALSSGKFDVVVLVVPSHLHCAMAKLALEARVHVLVEKPFALNMTEAEETVELAAKMDTSLTVVQNYRYGPTQLELARQISLKPLGELVAVAGEFRIWRQPKADYELAFPNPMLVIQGIHFLDGLRAILPSPIKEVHAVGHRSPISGWQNPSLWHLLMECESGVPVTLTGNYDSKATFTGYSGLWRFSCEKGDLLLNKEGCILYETEKGEERVFVPDPEARSGDSILLDTVHDAITQGTPAPICGADNLKTLELLFQIDSSS